MGEAFRAITEEEKDLEKFKTSFYAKILLALMHFLRKKSAIPLLKRLKKCLMPSPKKMLFSVAELNDNRIDPFSSFETINNRGKDLSTLELFKNRLHFVAHKICDKEKLENPQKNINDTYTLIYHDLRSFEDDDLERFLKHFVAYYYGENSNKFKERLLEYLERFGFLIYGVAGRDTAKNELIKPAFQAMKSYKEREENLTIEDLPELEKHFFQQTKS